ncbi:uncharacterized protein LOC129167935 [Dunckerocampus dactyliophorus]|uniref:uncharacterized protein LOC129167935 n=1 Tax=Dunckerocampus dactyliophorus TaxID=161453 RepID=UPI00240546C8|nr:uncharacterized protein LOC129167935 [Dunckerocampus dactyliophorus]
MQRKVKGPHARKKKPQNPVHPGFFLVTLLILIAVAMAWPWPNLSWPWDSVAAAQSTQATDELTTVKQDIEALKTHLSNLEMRMDELDEAAAAIVYIENVTRMVETQAATVRSLTTLVEKIDGVAKMARVEAATAHVDKLDDISDKRTVWFAVAGGGTKNHDKVVFGDVFTNEGNAYDANTGIFTAPCKGLYFFTLVYHSNGGTISLYVYREKKNGNRQWLMVLYDNTQTTGKYYMVTTSRMVDLEDGDKVYVWPDSGHVLTSDSANIFSGFLVHPM